ncbi:hypothetical protein BJ508DRAFT_317984 [Ascobolus immersus RN42]|uniref:DUF676 domain-containing protein n=1 Tax=Ascobolus immersus RN42 TaxID=1160509 RepID=A0A3N4I9F1_ASCIM|nr:hypothetical protein BJ508DRAFT_317984 [Ascobolus immersus RN42]
MTKISFIPSQLDTTSSSTPLPFRSSPLQLLASDMWLVLKLLLYVPHIFLPFRTKNKHAELYLADKGNVKELILHVVLTVLGLAYVFGGVAVGLLLPGWLGLAFWLLGGFIIKLVSRSLNYGEVTFWSDPSLEGGEGWYGNPEERWVFVNGVDAGKYWAQNNIDLLAKTFKRRILGIHNRSFGTVMDLVECLVQRCFGYATEDARVMYQYLKEQLMDESVKKCVIIAHSQGGIILANVLDSLFADLPYSALEKMEIYTFGCAANHFNNPLIRPSAPSSPTSKGEEERLITHIEHYANEYDFVARFGVLQFSSNPPDNRYVGRVFTRKGKGGHLLNQHYLDYMFPIEDTRLDKDFLDMEVDVDEDAAVTREGEAVGRGYVGTGGKAGFDAGGEVTVGGDTVGEASGGAGSGVQVQTGRGRVASAPAHGMSASDREHVREGMRRKAEEQGRQNARVSKGKTVKDLSRLWKYRGGGDPDGAVEQNPF